MVQLLPDLSGHLFTLVGDDQTLSLSSAYSLVSVFFLHPARAHMHRFNDNYEGGRVVRLVAANNRTRISNG